MIKVFASALMANISLICALPAFGQDISCDAVLAATTIRDNSNINIAIATLDLVTNDNFADFKKQFSSSASFPIKGIPVHGDTKFDEFQQSRKSFKEEHKFDYKMSEIRDLSVSYVSDKAIDSWLRCIEGGKKSTLIFRTQLISASNVIVQAKWLSPDGTSGRLSGKPEILGGQIDAADFPKEFKPKWTTFKVKREQNEPLSITIRLSNGDDAHINIPAFSTLYDAPRNCLRSSAAGCTSCSFAMGDETKSLSVGSTYTYSCEQMAHSENAIALIDLYYRVNGAVSGATTIHWEAGSPGGELQWQPMQRYSEDAAIPPLTRGQSARINGLRTSKSGRLSLEFILGACQWADADGRTVHQNCSITVEKGSKIKIITTE